MSPDGKALKTLLAKWTEWSKTADQAEDGWEGCFPEWLPLAHAAARLMEHPHLSDEELRMVEECWRMSEEDEDLADYAKAHLEECWTTLVRLADSAEPKVRWQIYEVLGEAGEKGVSILRRGVHDEDAYCRRRAVISIVRLSLPDAEESVARMLDDPDPTNRIGAQKLLRKLSGQGPEG